MLFKATICAGFLAFSLSGHAQDSLRILTWNIQMLPFPAKSNGRAKRAKAIVEILKQHTYDVIVFQEAFKGRSRRIIKKGLVKEYPHQTKVLNQKAIALKVNGGVTMISAHPIREVHEIRYRARRGFDKYARKGAMLVELDVRGKPLQVLGTHLQAFGTTEILYAQYQQLHDELLKPFAKHGVPQFICGDFNTRKTATATAGSSEGGPPLSRYDYMLQTLGAEDGELAGDQQFTMDRPYNDLCEGNKEARILLDYILVRPAGEDIEIKREVRIMRQQWTEQHRDLSDHFGVEAVVLWKR